MSFSNGPGIVTTDLVLALDASDRNSYVSGSTTWKSLVGSYSGSLIGSSSFNSGPPATFVNNITTITQSAFLLVNELQFLDQTTYTLDFWIKMRSGVQATYQSLVGWGSTNNWISVFTNTTDGSSWNVSFRDLNLTYTTFSNVTDYNIVNNWANVTLTADISRNLNFYLNGAFKETKALPTTSFVRITRIMGGYSSGGNEYNLQGSMSAAKFYNTTLSSSEVLQNYNALKTRFNLT